MARKSSIWYRERENAWYTTVNRQQHRLGTHPEGAPPPNKTDAGWNPPPEIQAEFHRFMAERLQKPEEPKMPRTHPAKQTFAFIANAFLEHSRNTNAPETYRGHRLFLRGFSVYVGKIRFCDLTPYQFNRWVETKKSWKAGGRRGAVNVVKACLNWWCNEHNIPFHPLCRLKAPPDRARDGILSAEDQQRVLDYLPITDPFRLFFFALQQTGCRPSEVRRVCAEHFDADQGVWIMPGKTTRKTGKPRIVFLTPALVEMCKVLVAHNKGGGPIFRNRQNKQWGRQGIDYRFAKLAKDLHLPGLASYTLRRSFVTLGLERGVPIAQMATLAGHTDTKMIMKHYSKLASEIQHMREQAQKAADGKKE